MRSSPLRHLNDDLQPQFMHQMCVVKIIDPAYNEINYWENVPAMLEM